MTEVVKEVERLREVFTLENFKAWLATKPANEAFDYGSNTACATAQFAQAHGFPNARAGGDYVRTGEENCTPYDRDTHVEYPADLDEAYHRFNRNNGNTFGELLFELNEARL